MHTLDVLHYGHRTLMKNLEVFPKDEYLTPGACGTWSVKDILAHLASYEQVLAEVTMELQGEQPTPTLDLFRSAEGFNDREVEDRREQSFEATLEEYVGSFEHAVSSVADLPEERLTEAGALDWYGNEYDLEDFLIYSFYGHKREHSAQIAAFKDHLES
ncbi:MAG: DinB family protein [Anaerolineales bacterium]|nr:DinB family protein [Anaerolineales bacterium]